MWTTIINENKISIGQSKLGGVPDLPKNIEWPLYVRKPLHFIAQFNLAEIHLFDIENALPNNGMLYFFYDAYEQPWGFNPDDKGRWKVFYFSVETLLERRIEPKDIIDPAGFSTCSISFSKQTTLPSWDTLFIKKLNLSKEERDLYFDLTDKIAEINRSEGLVNRILGHPDMIQGEMQLESQLVFNGLYCGDSSGYNDPRRLELETGASNWKLLLQIDSLEDIGMLWGDVGRIYFWIRDQDLINEDFNNTWLILQC